MSAQYDYDIYLENLETKEKFRFPMLPQSIHVQTGTRYASYDIMNIGEIKTPLGEELTVFSWEGVLPGKARENEPYVRDYTDPISTQEMWSYFRVSGCPLHLTVACTPINHTVYLDNYMVDYEGSMGDYRYNIQFSHRKELKITTEPPQKQAPSEGGLMKGVVALSKNIAKKIENVYNGKAKAKENRSSQNEDGYYVVKDGDSIWKIAQSQLGDGSRYNDIAILNGISNPDKINAGQKLTMPKK